MLALSIISAINIIKTKLIPQTTPFAVDILLLILFNSTPVLLSPSGSARDDAILRENIAMARPDATDEEIITAAKAAHAHGFIKRLKDGYNTVLGEGGEGLSQGQRQLLCISRIMLALPPMLILDEATSSIDTRTEIRIHKAFLEMMKGRTSFIVAHRLSTIREADVILVMRDGNIVESGSHTELLERRGCKQFFYSRIYIAEM